MAGIEHGRDAGGAQRRIPTRVLARHERKRWCGGRVAQKRGHGVRYLGLAFGRLDLCHAGEVCAAAVGELSRKVEGSDAGERRSEVIDRVVLHRPRAVSARVRHFQSEVLWKLLARLDIEGDLTPARVEFPGGALVERERGVGEIAAALR